MELTLAPDVKSLMLTIQKKLKLNHLQSQRIVCFRSYGSRSRAQARIWAFPRIWQLALSTRPHYCVEVLAERFDKLNREDKIKVLIHELLHIPKNFSGSLLSHGYKRRHLVNNQRVNSLYDYYFSRR